MKLHTAILPATALLLCDCTANNTPMIAALAAEGNTAACYEYGHRLLTGRLVAQNRPQAMKWLHLAADKGSIRAAAALGACYANGIGTQKNTQKARHWYTIAAEARHPHAEIALAEHYMKVEPTNPQLAVQYIRYAAMQGSPEAAFGMFLCFVQGYGVPRHPKLAGGWLINAAELGHPCAISLLEDIAAASAPSAE